MADHDLKVSREERKKQNKKKETGGERNEKQKAGVMNIKRYKGILFRVRHSDKESST